jgi:hypothetical protein
MKIAKLVTISLMSRMIVDEDIFNSLSETEQIEYVKELSIQNLEFKLRNEFHEHLEEIIDDNEVPYDEVRDILIDTSIPYYNLPLGIQKEMLDEQERQGNTKNPAIFISSLEAPTENGGFDWAFSLKGFGYWAKELDIFKPKEKK